MLNYYPQLKYLDYREKLKHLNLLTLGKRRLRGDLIETYNIFNGLDKINRNIFLRLTNPTPGDRVLNYINIRFGVIPGRISLASV